MKLLMHVKRFHANEMKRVIDKMLSGGNGGQKKEGTDVDGEIQLISAFE